MRPLIVLDAFGRRQFDKANKTVSSLIDFDPAEFALYIDQLHQRNLAVGKALVDGYAPFCKHIFVPNFVNARASYMRITPENESSLQSAYVARTERELPVLQRWFPADKVQAPLATYLDVILYSREQINLENAATGAAPEMVEFDGQSVAQDAPWGIISIKPQLEDFETPMTPITAMRNALPKAEGGSGVALNRDQYLAAVNFWSTHAMISNH